MNIRQKIRAFHECIVGNEHHRYRSWEHCYRYFHRIGPRGLAAHEDQAAIQLGFYLASWGMYRGSGFLLQHAYTIHLGAIRVLGAPCFAVLWEREFGVGSDDAALVPIVMEAVGELRLAYRPFVSRPGRQPTDTLVTKIVLGTFGCLPAVDRYFIAGFKAAGLKYSALNARFVHQVLGFGRKHLRELQDEQLRIKNATGIYYPIMKLVDMYFWQVGSERGNA